jgi:hypothetical protein
VDHYRADTLGFALAADRDGQIRLLGIAFEDEPRDDGFFGE